MRDLGPAELFVAGALGEPGNRHFYLQITAAGETLWLHAEKQQVSALGSQSLTLLATAGIEPDDEAVTNLKSDLILREPEQELFAVGDIQLALLESEMITVSITSADEEETIRFLIVPEQIQAMAEVALDVVSAGRPICPHCHLPKDPGGHRCPATNGHFPD